MFSIFKGLVAERLNLFSLMRIYEKLRRGEVKIEKEEAKVKASKSIEKFRQLEPS
jgi:hypothetical protein